MTFQQAQDIIDSKGKVIIYQDRDWVLKILPFNTKDFNNYLSDIKTKYISNEDAKNYSSDADFIVYRFLLSFHQILYEELEF